MSIFRLTRLVSTHPGWFWVPGVRARAQIIKTRESVAKSLEAVNEKNAGLAW